MMSAWLPQPARRTYRGASGGSKARSGSIEQRLGSIEQRLDRVIFALFGFGAALAAGIVGILVKLFLDAA